MQFWINSVKSITKDVHSNSWFLTDCKWAHIKSNFPVLHRLQMSAWRQPLSTLSITNGGMFCSSKPCFWASSTAVPRVLLSPRRAFMTSAWRMQLWTRSSWLGEIMWLAMILAAQLSTFSCRCGETWRQLCMQTYICLFDNVRKEVESWQDE